jgi:hypothetical protein
MTRNDWRAMTADERLEIVQAASMDGSCEVICRDSCNDCGCEVEPDGRCEHGCRSVLLAVGMI